jgi:small-conductance mechanosensitive channel
VILKLVYFVLVTLLYLFLHRWIVKLMGAPSTRMLGNAALALYLKKFLIAGITVLYLVLLGLIIGIEYSELTIFLSSVFAIVGVALFAQWSILSNITASLVIFFGFPYRIGDRVKVMDRDDSIIGMIEEISLFCVQIRDDSGNLATFPNNLFLQRAVVKLDAPEPAEEVEPLHD